MTDRDSDLDPGLRAAYGGGDSVLSRLEETSGVVPRILLDEPAGDESPIVKPGAGCGDGAPPRTLGPYQVMGEIARGGVGVVLKGRDVDLGRDVALKLLRPGLDENPAIVQRFVEEAQVEGQLQHPGIVPVYGLGLESEGRPYFAMKLVKGETLGALLSKRKSPMEDGHRFLGAFEQVCQAVAYAHARHVIHRDLKPANVLVGAFGEVQVVDWGFAKVLPRGGVADERRSLRPDPATTMVRTVRTGSTGSESQAGSVMGTPAYLPPEQAMGDVDRTDARSDVFGLGGILAEILTGKPPYVSEDGDVFRQALGCRLDPCFGRLADCGAEEALVAIAKRCLSPEPADRYRDAGELAAAIGGHLAAVEERARSAEVAAAEARVKAGEERKKKRLVLALASSVMLLVLLGGGGAWWMTSQRQARLSDAVARARGAMARAERLAGEAANAPVGETGPHEAALAEARRALEMAGEADEETRRAAEALVAGVEEQRAAARVAAREWQRDRDMVEKLRGIRMGRGDRFEAAVTEAEYSRAFADHGVDLDALSLEEAASRITASGIRDELCDAMDDWAMVRWELTTAGPEGKRKLLDIARLADPDLWRNRLRTAAVERDAGTLLDLAESADVSMAASSIVLLGRALVRVGETDRAIALARDALRARPDAFWLCYHLGYWLEGRDWQESVRWYTAALGLRPGSYGVLHRLGIALNGAGRVEDAVEVWEEALRLHPDELHLHVHLAGALKKAGGLEDALRRVKARTEGDPGDFDAWFELGQLALAGERWKDATDAFREAVGLRPGDYRGRFQLAWALVAAGRWPEAREAAEAFLEIQPYSANGHMLLGRAIGAEGTGDPAAAEEEYRRAVDLAPGDGLYYQSLGTCLLTQGKLDEALDVYRDGLARRCRDPAFLWTGIAGVEQRRGRLGEAELAYRKAIELEPRLPSQRMYLGILLCDVLARYDEAATEFREILRLDPENRSAWVNLGVALLKQGDLEGAIEALQGGRKRGTLRRGDRLSLVTLLNSTGRLEEKLRVVEEALREAPGDPNWLFQAGIGRLALGRTEGIEQLRRSTLFPAEGYPPERWEADLAALAGLAPRLSGIAFGADRPEDVGEKLLAAHLLTYGARFCRAAELFLEAGETLDRFVEQPGPGGLDRHIYNAICAAAQVGSGRGLDAGLLSGEERRRWREQALAWSRENLSWWRDRLDAGGLTPEQVARAGTYWRNDLDLAGVRTPLGLSALSEDERREWKAFWADLDALIERAKAMR